MGISCLMGGGKIKNIIQLNLLAVIISVWMVSTAIAEDSVTSLSDAFTKGKVSGTLKSYYFSQAFDGACSFKAGTDAYQIGAAYKYCGLSSTIRYTNFDNLLNFP